MDHEETDNRNEPSTSELQEEDQKGESAISNNSQLNISGFKSEPCTSEESLIVQQLPLYESGFGSYRSNNDFSSDNDSSYSSESSDENLICEIKQNDENDARHSDKKAQEKYERMVEKINKIILRGESFDDFVNIAISSHEKSVTDCNTSHDNKESTSESSSSFPFKNSTHCSNILKSEIEIKENSSMSFDLSFIRFQESSNSNTSYKTEKDNRGKNLQLFSPDQICPTKFTHSSVLEHFPSTSKYTRDWDSSNMLTCDNNHGNKEKTSNSSDSQDCKEKLSRFLESSSNSHEFICFSPNNNNKRTRKSYKLNSDDSESSSDDAKRNFQRIKGTEKRRKIVPFNASDSSKHYLTFPRAGSNENISEDADTFHKRNSEEKLKNSKGKESPKNILRSLEIINSGNIDTTRKRHVSSDESEDVGNREADRKQRKKLRHRTYREK